MLQHSFSFNSSRLTCTLSLYQISWLFFRYVAESVRARTAPNTKNVVLVLASKKNQVSSGFNFWFASHIDTQQRRKPIEFFFLNFVQLEAYTLFIRANKTTFLYDDGRTISASLLLLLLLFFFFTVITHSANDNSGSHCWSHRLDTNLFQQKLIYVLCELWVLGLVFFSFMIILLLLCTV